MNALHVRHVRDALRRDFDGRIDLDDLQGQPPDELDRAFLSRALAALAVQDRTSCAADVAAATVIDGYDDNGIDAVAMDDVGPHLWLVQAKWKDNGRAGLDQAGALRLKRGLDLILNSEYRRFNARFRALADRVDAVLGKPDVKITLVVALLGDGRLAEPVQDVLDSVSEELQPTLDYVVLGLPDFHRMIRSGVAEPRIDLEVRLEQPGDLTEPYRAFYGTMFASDIAQWYADHGSRLFQQNLRHALGLTQVNQGLAETLTLYPEHFWYFNNGVTVLCESIQRTPRYATAVGGPAELHVTGASVVNGAQTVFAVHDAMRRTPERRAGAGSGSA